MPKIEMTAQEFHPTLPADTILALRVDQVVVKEVEGNRGPWQKLDFTFKITGVQSVGDGSPPEHFASLIGDKIWGSVPFRLTDSPENKLRMWVEAILGMELGLGFELDTDMLENRTCRGITSTWNKRTTNPATGKPFTAHQIDSLLRANTNPIPTPSFTAPTAQASAQPAPSSATSSVSAFDDEPPF